MFLLILAYYQSVNFFDIRILKKNLHASLESGDIKKKNRVQIVTHFCSEFCGLFVPMVYLKYLYHMDGGNIKIHISIYYLEK